VPDSKQTIFTVSRLNSAVRILLEQEMGLVWLVGELSNLVLHSSGHWYFSLKDSAAQVRGAMFRGSNRRVSFRPQEGQQVLVQARLSLYEPRGEYQLIIETMRPAGEGQLQLQLEQLKQRLHAEGLFASERKRPLPQQPRQIGLITSPTGAAIHDMLTVLKRRAPGIPVVLYPAQVQGAQAAEQLIAALNLANRRDECDVLIIGRGGGASEDLWCFNDERLVRAIASSLLPIISAVGHESDITLSDFAADVRAATPSAAAELVSPDQASQRQRLQMLLMRLNRASQHSLTAASHRLTMVQKSLHHQHPERRLQQQQQRLDELQGRLRLVMQQRLSGSERQLERLAHRLQPHAPHLWLREARQRLQQYQQRLHQYWQQRLDQQRHRHGLLLTRLDAMSPLATLARGYSITQNEQGQVLRSVNQASTGQTLTTRLGDGELRVQVTEISTRNH
jgi:exodeoxyribonuclease VII large subunit